MLFMLDSKKVLRFHCASVCLFVCFSIAKSFMDSSAKEGVDQLRDIVRKCKKLFLRFIQSCLFWQPVRYEGD